MRTLEGKKALGVIVLAKGVAQIAGETDLSYKGLYKAFSRDRSPNSATVLRVI
jgi:probable addiction module antidote protein